ncbi:VOC family protein [Pseudomonas sp. B21-056]|jgi:catechol 2,3-dioxygenase-like lactoylglutathione lyase family enzyme|uniref:VOC family protein n=1 Tax=Pseudomonas sp. B21-056 TaxID=2895495 RepID=UPI00222F0C6C|nr:VOC family protein [Pseudomonas sp. B21-056]UZE25900.1 VOC family protein [Pseudomonas sp. B21-056]
MTTTTIKSTHLHVDARRAANRVGKLHHHAFLAKDMEATRHFYEDILGMPLVGTWVERVNPVTGQPDNYIHTFFELSDGSCLAFFQFKSQDASLEQSINRFADINPFAHHLALTVAGRDEIQYFKARLSDAGVQAFETDHGYCYSIYFHDPNGMQVELTTLVPQSQQMMDEAAVSAHEMLKKWLTEDEVAGNNAHRGAGWVASETGF